MQSFRRRNLGVSVFSPKVRALGIIVLIVVLGFVALRLLAPGAFVSFVSPFWNVGTSLTGGFSGIADSFGNTRALTEDRDRLMEENAALSAALQSAEAALADYGKLGSSQGILAGVIASPPVAPYDVLILSGGTGAGVRPGHLVYGNGGVPVGVIAEASDETSRAVLFSEAGRETHGWAGEERIPVVLVGRGSGTFEITVAKDTSLVAGAQVYLPGPGALAIGMISRIESDPASPDARIYVFPYANPFTLSQVRVGPTMLP